MNTKSERLGLTGPHYFLEHNSRIVVADQLVLTALHTPGHTPGHLAFALEDRVFTGDALLIGGCGRTDFQGGDSTQLYHTLHHVLLKLPDETLIYPAHDYQGRTVSAVRQELQTNPRVALSEPDFIAHLAHLNLPRPKFMDWAIPANLQCGLCDFSQPVPSGLCPNQASQ